MLRWLEGARSAPQPAPEVTAPPAAVAPEPEARRPAPPPPAPRAAKPPKVATAPAVADTVDALPVETSFEDPDFAFVFDARGGDGFGARSGDLAHAGNFALFSQASSAANRGWPGWQGRRYAVTPGRTYVLRAWAVSPDGANAWLDLGLYDRAGAWLGGRSTGCSRERPGQKWQLLELRYVNDKPGVTSIRPALLHCLNHTKGRSTTLFFDDVSLAGQ